MKQLSVGVLLPYSTILPVSKDFEKGIKAGIAAHGAGNVQIEIIKEFIGQGSTKQTEDAVSKFFNFHEVDVITGIVSHKVADDIAEQFEKKQIPFIVSDLGGHIPDVGKLNGYTYLNSMHLWQHAWAIGKWGVETFGPKGMYVAALYDSGYSFSQMFHAGMMAADVNAQWSFSVCPMPASGALSDISVVFPFIEQNQPDFIFANFCGTETTLFLNEFISRGWHKKTNIIGLPYIISPFAPLDDDITIYSTLAAKSNTAVAPLNAFFHLGYEAGIIISQAALNGENINTELQKLFEGMRLSQQSLSYTKPYNIQITKTEIKAGTSGNETELIGTLDNFSGDYDSMKSLINEINFGWMNPYLCI